MPFRQIKSLNKFTKKRFFNSEKGMAYLNIGVNLMGTFIPLTHCTALAGIFYTSWRV
jgi:hypothetical protein